MKNLNGKEALTKFSLEWYDEKTNNSLVKCEPITGKTHQIRIHLKYLGFSIINDIFYGGEFINKNLNKNFSKKMCFYLENDYEICGKKKIKLDENSEKVILNCEKNIMIEKKEWNFSEHIFEIFLHAFEYEFNNIIIKTDPPFWVKNKDIYA